MAQPGRLTGKQARRVLKDHLHWLAAWRDTPLAADQVLTILRRRIAEASGSGFVAPTDPEGPLRRVLAQPDRGGEAP